MKTATKKTSGKVTLNISDKFVCLAVKVKTFCNTKMIRDVTDANGNGQVKVNSDPNRIKARKTLIESPEMDDINKYLGQTKAWVKSRCLNSIFKGGMYILPNDLIESVQQYLIGTKAHLAMLIAVAEAAYPQRVVEAAEELKMKDSEGVTMFDPNDYPTPEEYAACFSIDWRFLTFDVPDSLKSVSESLYQREKEKAEAHWRAINDEVTVMLRGSMAQLVTHMVDKLSPSADGKKKMFHSTLTGNFNDFLQTFEARNITDDKELSAIVAQARLVMSGVEVKDLRDDETLRNHVKAKMDELKDKLSSMVVVKPTRTYSIEDV